MPTLMTTNLNWICPICGASDQIDEPRSITDGDPSFEHCPCCLFQFGFHDDSEGYSYSEWRGHWISQGMHYGLKGEPQPAEWNPTSQLMSLLARGEPDLIIFSGNPTPDDTDRRAASAVASVSGLIGLSRAWRQRPGDFSRPVRVFVAQVESLRQTVADERIGAALTDPADHPYMVEIVAAGDEQVPYRQLLVERGVTLYTR